MNCKTTGLALVAACCAFLGACNNPSMSNHSTEGWIDVTPNHKEIQAGETVRLTTTTGNLVGAKAIRWTVTPTANGARIDPEGDMGSKTAKFTADQPGTYTVHADVDMGNGKWAMSSTNVLVDAKPGTQ